MDNVTNNSSTFIDATLQEFKDWCKSKGYYNISTLNEILAALKEFEESR